MTKSVRFTYIITTMETCSVNLSFLNIYRILYTRVDSHIHNTHLSHLRIYVIFLSICNLSIFCSCKVLVVGGGSGGCALAAKLSSRLGKGKVVVLEPKEVCTF